MSAASALRDMRGWLVIVAIGLAWTVHRGTAQQQPEEVFDLRIAAQPLDDALQEFSRQSGMQVIFFSNLTKGIQSPGASGKYSVADALRKLLAGSGLSFRVINARTVEIREADAAQSFEDGGEQ